MKDYNDDYSGPEHCDEHYTWERDLCDGSYHTYYHNSKGVHYEVYKCVECGEVTNNDDAICSYCRSQQTKEAAHE